MGAMWTTHIQLSDSEFPPNLATARDRISFTSRFCQPAHKKKRKTNLAKANDQK